MINDSTTKEEDATCNMFTKKVERDDLRAVFGLFDEDKNGLISEDELKTMVKSFGRDTAEVNLKEVVSKFDANGNGQIDFEEFVTLMRDESASEVHGDVELLAAFRLIDVDNSGKISVPEIRALVAKTNENLSHSEVSDLLKDIDVNGDGEIDFEEFRELMTYSGPSLSA